MYLLPSLASQYIDDHFGGNVLFTRLYYAAKSVV